VLQAGWYVRGSGKLGGVEAGGNKSQPRCPLLFKKQDALFIIERERDLERPLPTE